ncbi:flavodoxin [Algicola sagamiensis]|uniref:flavodoxin n=1 Tax=Algicola sagamiensis TaxID=163869 RepID=UPI00037B7190|nr:flavodoxin [Algicola sagamiensis]
MAKIAIVVGTVYGAAQFVAEQAAEVLEGLSHQVNVYDDPEVSKITAPDVDFILVISSTTGAGDLPPNITEFYVNLKDQFPLLTGKQFAVIALGDSSYGETYCGGGAQLDALFEELQATRLKGMLKIDACEYMQPEDAALPWIKSWAENL